MVAGLPESESRPNTSTDSSGGLTGQTVETETDPRSISYSSSATDINCCSSSRSSCDTWAGGSSSSGSSKPHKANDAGWEAIRSVKSQNGNHLGLAHFRLMHKLGSGDIGSVYLTELRGTDCYFAMKVMDKKALTGRNKLLRAQAEREILEMLDHPFLPTLYAHLETPQFSCLVMEFCPGGDLHVLRQRQPGKRFSEHAARFYASEVLLCLEYLHMLGIIYRDLKPENVLVREDGHIMLTDFDLSLKCSVRPTLLRPAEPREPHQPQRPPPGPPGPPSCILPACVLPCATAHPRPVVSCLPMFHRFGAGKKQQKQPTRRRRQEPQSPARPHGVPELVAEPTDARSMSFVGTHEYLAPEIVLGEGHGSAVDWWTFGVFLFELLHGRTPFRGSDNEKTLANVVSQPLEFPAEGPAAGGAARDLIRALLVKDPSRRLASARGAAEIKHHEFFAGINWALIRCSIPPEIPSPFNPPPPPPPPPPPAARRSDDGPDGPDDDDDEEPDRPSGANPKEESASEFEYF